jgi:hypothetical protein
MSLQSDDITSTLALPKVQRKTYDLFPTTSRAKLYHAAFLGIAPNVPEDDVQLEVSMFPVCEPLMACHPKCKRAVQQTIVACTRWMYAQDTADRASAVAGALGSSSLSAAASHTDSDTHDSARVARAKCEALTDSKHADAACDDKRDNRENCFESVATGFRVLLKK